LQLSPTGNRPALLTRLSFLLGVAALSAMNTENTGFNGNYKTVILGPTVFVVLLVLVLASIVVK
jgi:hypothetical protein